MRLLPSLFLSTFAVLLCSCQPMRFPWSQNAATTGYDANNWNQQAQAAGAQWGQGTQTNQTAPANQGWDSTANAGANAGWGNTTAPDQQQSGNWANDGWNANSNPAPASNTNTNTNWNSSPASTSSNSGRSHTVVKGDTLTNIASRNGTSVRRIMAANNISDPNRIQLGQRLVIP